MKRWGLLAAAALLSIGTALAEEEPSRHIRTTISGEAYAVAVDAGVYGEEQKAVQAYRVTTLDLGKNPEAHFDLALWFGADALLEKREGITRFSIRRAKMRKLARETRRVSAHTACILSARQTLGWNFRWSDGTTGRYRKKRTQRKSQKASP